MAVSSEWLRHIVPQSVEWVAFVSVWGQKSLLDTLKSHFTVYKRCATASV